MINHRMTGTDWAMLLSLSLLWGGSFFFVAVAVPELPPLTIATLRVGVAAVVLWVLLLLLKKPIPKTPKLWWTFFVTGLLNNALPYTLITWGQTSIASGLASILNATTPLFTILVAGMLLADEHITLKKTIGVGIGFFGVIVLISPSLVSTTDTDIWPQMAVLGGAASYALATTYARRFKAMGISPFDVSIGQLTASTIMLLPMALVIEQPYQLENPSTDVWLAILGLGVFSTALAYILYFRILSSSGAVNVTLVTFLVPVSAILLGWLILDEQLHSEHLAGMAFIGLGLAVIDGRLWSTIRDRTNPALR